MELPIRKIQGKDHNDECFVVVARRANNFYFRTVEYFALYMNPKLACWHECRLNRSEIINLIKADAIILTCAWDYRFHQCHFAGLHIICTKECEYIRSNHDGVLENNLLLLPMITDKEFNRLFNAGFGCSLNQFVELIFRLNLAKLNLRYEINKCNNIGSAVAS